MESYEVELPVYEGPLDLLLSLVTKNKIDIHDIPIHEITDQYLAYLAAAKARSLDLESSFFTMAAQLLLIKSRTLLPRREPPEGEDTVDPREELARSIEEFKRMKEMKARVEALLREEEPYHGKEPETLGSGLYEGSISTARLRAVFQSLYEERGGEEALLPADEVTLPEETEALREALGRGHPLSLTGWLRGRKTRLRLAVSFMALLELIRLGEVCVREDAGGLVIEGRSRTGRPADGSAH